MIGMDLIYKGKRLDNIEVLVDDTYDGYRYVIITLGTHPCAYVVLPSGHKLYGKDYDEIGVSVHGGLTYSRDYLGRDGDVISSDDGVWVIGWDYAHLDDWYDLFSVSENLGMGNHRWSVDEISGDVLDCINQISSL